MLYSTPRKTYHINGREELPNLINANSFVSSTNRVKQYVAESRNAIKNILNRKEKKFIIIAGPCSIHDQLSGFDYAKKLKTLADQVSDKIFIVMRGYFEKPRTNIGWKGFINDPELNNSFNISQGINKARQFLLTVNELELPVATEFVDPIIMSYVEEFISWGAIGARTVESQVHRQIASATNLPIGFKNNIQGSVDAAINAIISAANSHTFIGTNNQGKTCIIRSIGNKYSHIVMRGSNNGPNYDKEHITLTEKKLEQAGLAKNILVDCSHGNSNKNYKGQRLVVDNIIEQIEQGNQSIVGIMLESNIYSGSQQLTENPADLTYGVSITDECIGWEETQKIIHNVYQRLKNLPQYTTEE